MSESKKRLSIGDALRDRGIKPKADIGEVWASQKRNSTTVKTAKTKKTKKTNSFTAPKVIVGKHLSKARAKAGNSWPKYKKKVLNLKVGAFVGVSLIIIVLFNVIIGGGKDSSNESKSTDTNTSNQLGASSSSESGIEQNGTKLPEVTNTDFEMMWPKGKSASDFTIVRVSPPEQPSVYAYIDSLDGEDIKISQQPLPAELEEDPEQKVKELAEDFNATNVIEIDGNPIYHGFSDKNGETQSLVFTKNGLLFFIASPKKISDDIWAGYISNYR